MAVGAKLDDLHQRPQLQRDRTHQLEETVARQRDELEQTIDEVRAHIDALQLGGLTIAALGAQLLVVDIVLMAWPEWVAQTPFVQLIVPIWPFATVSAWVPSEHRRWWS